MAPILFVAGFGRCGTTMVMTMLDRGGFPTTGPRPDYELPDRISPERGVDREWVRTQAGRAVKWIDPLRARISRNDLPRAPIIIHMDRPSRDMAASQVKLLQFSGAIVGSRNARRAMAASLDREKPTLAARLNATGTVYHMSFGWVLADPQAAAGKLAAIIAHEFEAPFDAAAAACVPFRRGAGCAPDMAIEERLLMQERWRPSPDATERP